MLNRTLNSGIAPFVEKLLLFVLVLGSSFAPAQSGPTSLNLSGSLFNADGSAVMQTSVTFKIEMWDDANACLLYSETFSGVDLSGSKGGFSLQLGSSGTGVNNVDGTLKFDDQLFLNPGSSTTIHSGCTANLSAGHTRVIHISYDLGSGSVAMNPPVVVTNTPYAMVADTLQGKAASDFLMTNNNTSLSQANVENVFSTTNYPVLLTLLAGNDNNYISSSPTATVGFNGQRLTNLAAPTSSSDAVTKSYADADLGGLALNTSGVGAGLGGGKTLVWDQVANQWVAQAVGSVSSITAGTGLLGGTISNSGTISVDVGTSANQLVQLNSSAALPSLDGSLLFNVNAGFLGGRAVASAIPTSGQVLTYNAALSQWVPGTSSGITALTGDVTASGPGSAVSTISNDAVNASAKIKSTGISTNRLVITDAISGTTLAYGACSLNQIYQWTSTGWGCADVSSMLGNVNTSAVGTYGNAAQVAQVTVDAQGRITQLSNVNIAFPVTMVAGRTGSVTLSTTDISGLGSAALQNYGTAAGNLVQFDPSARYPANDGSQITNVNAADIMGKAVGSIAPTAGQVMTFNGTLGQWDAESSSASLNSFVQGGNSFGTNAILGTNDANSLSLRANGAMAMTILPSGYVGIGTANPQVKLQSMGSVAAINSSANTSLASATAADIGFFLQNSDPTPGNFQAISFLNAATASQAAIAGINDGSSSNAGGHLIFATRSIGGSGVLERARIDENGFLGINTTTPGTWLNVVANTANAANTAAQFQASATHTGNGNFSEYGSVSAANSKIASGASNTGGSTGAYVYALRNYNSTGDAGSLAGQSGEIVAFGHFNSDSSAPSTSVAVGLMVNPYIMTGSITNMYDIFLSPPATGGTAAARWGIFEADPAQNYFAGPVGLGTSSPTTALDINGALTERAMASPGVSSAGQGRIYFDSASNQFLVSQNGSAYSALAGTANAFVKGGNTFGAASTLGTQDNYPLSLIANNTAVVSVLPDGTVGIGTTATQSLVTIGSDTYDPTQRQTIQLLEGGYDVPSADGAFSNGDKFIMWNSSPVKNSIGNDAYGLWSQSSGHPNSHIAFWTGSSTGVAPTERMRIDSGGNVGIGTSTMGSTLVVNGTVQLGSSGTQVHGMGTCSLGAAFAAASGANSKSCTGVALGAPVYCSPAAAPGTATVTWGARASAAGTVSLNLSAAFTTSTTWTCMFMNP